MIDAINEAFDETFTTINTLIGNINGTINFSNIDDVYDILTSDAYNGIALPTGFNETIWDSMY